jgi:type VI secretion system protein ImpG
VFSRYYQDELAYLRDLGREFSQTYPALAPLLDGRGGDPDVERLLEGFAFLTGRIRQKLDDELPELILSIASLLFPELIRPLPSASILELLPIGNSLRERRLVAQGSEFDSGSVDGVRCRFRSSNDVELVPWTLGAATLEATGAGQDLHFELNVPSGVPLRTIAPQSIRLFLSGEERVTLTLATWFAQHTTGVVLSTAIPGQSDAHEVHLGRDAVVLPGFEELPLLPALETSFPGFRLLQEYYTLPAKFCFVDIQGVSRLMQLASAATRMRVTVRFDSRIPGLHGLPKDTLKLHCVPVVNVFATTAEPVRVVPERQQFLIRPAGLGPAQGEVFSIEQVRGLATDRGSSYVIPSFFEFSHGDAQSDNRVCYSVHLQDRKSGV